MLWELLTGRQLFPSGKARGAQGRRPPRSSCARAQPRVVPPSQRAPRVPPELDGIALKALAPDLKERYATLRGDAPALATWLAQNAPGHRRARGSRRFLHELFAEDMAASGASARS